MGWLTPSVDNTGLGAELLVPFTSIAPPIASGAGITGNGFLVTVESGAFENLELPSATTDFKVLVLLPLIEAFNLL